MQKLILFLTLLPFLSIAQVDYFGRTYSDELPENFKVKLPEIREHILKTIPEEFIEKKPRATFQFSDQVAISLQQRISSGNVYSDWPGLENYLNDIFKKIIPEELANDSVLHAYVLKNSYINASMTPAGMSFFNIGMFDQLYNEATIAGVLAHELAHYVLKHGVKGFIKAENKQFKTSVFKTGDTYSQFSIKNELQADSMAMIWMDKSGYSVDGLIEIMNIFERNEKSALLRSRDVWELKETSHPRSSKRLKILEDYKESKKSNPGKYFLVSEEKFIKYSTALKPEILKHLLNGFDYRLCLEKAFKYHIFDPENPVYVYYIMESIRRMCYLNPDLWRKKFIVNNYHNIVEKRGSKYKEKMEAHIFEKFPVEILRINPKVARHVKARFYWKDEPKFITYEEAFVFFYKVAELLDAKECVLSNALSITTNDKIRNGLLEKYLAYENVKYRDFAESLLKGKITEKLNDKKLTVFGGLQAVVRQGKEEIFVRDEKSPDDIQLQELFKKAMAEFPDKDHLFLNDLKNGRLNDYQLLSELESFSFMSTYAKGEKTELHILDPRYWEAMNNFNVNEIEFINARYYDSRKADYTLEGYKSIIQSDYNQLFSETKRNRYVDIYITSVRQLKDGVMKIKYYGGEEKLAFKAEAYDQLVELLKVKQEAKEKRAREIDKENVNRK